MGWNGLVRWWTGCPRPPQQPFPNGKHLYRPSLIFDGFFFIVCQHKTADTRQFPRERLESRKLSVPGGIVCDAVGHLISGAIFGHIEIHFARRSDREEHLVVAPETPDERTGYQGGEITKTYSWYRFAVLYNNKTKQENTKENRFYFVFVGFSWFSMQTKRIITK